MMAAMGRENLMGEAKFEVAVKFFYYLLSFFNRKANFQSRVFSSS